MFRALHAARRLRGTALDPFRRSPMRRLERELVDEYRALVHRAAAQLTSDTQDAVAEIAALPELIRGYEDIKLANVARYRRECADRLERLESSLTPA
jgi:indolepyruvate ferredoxin oxidoreductase